MRGFSIILCTHNPDKLMFKDVVANLLSIMENSDVVSELIIVDNNSNPPLNHIIFLSQLLRINKKIKLVSEIKPGLTFARIAGFKKAHYDWIIYVDDDNLPNCHYLNELTDLSERYPEVKCWGAGTIQVLFENSRNTNFLESVRPLFQQRHFKGVNYSCNIKGEEYYPPGSSMCIEKYAFKRYLDLINKGIITSSDRTGNNLNSAGDTQIIYCCLKNGYYVGCSENLILKHLISSKKMKLTYLLKLKYALDSCQIRAFNEVFPERAISVTAVTNKEILISIYSHLRIKKIFPIKNTFLEFASTMGMFNARILAGGGQKPILLRLFEKMINYR